MISFQNIFFRWHRWTWGDAVADDPHLEVVPGLRRHTDLGRAPAPVDPLPSLRASLAAGLDDPSRTARDPVFEAFAPYVDALATGSPLPEDVALVRRALADPRVTELYRASRLEKAFDGDLTPFRAALVERITTSTPEQHQDAERASHMLYRMPPGTFAPLTPAEDALLDDPDRRVHAGGLIARLADQGAPAVPRLLSLLDAHVPRLTPAGRSERRQALALHGPVIDGVQAALCQLGPDAASARARIEQLSTDGSLPMAGRESWRILRVRLGTPVDVVVPDTHPNHARLRSRIRRQVQRIEQGQRCPLG